jgi:hypothetical protein
VLYNDYPEYLRSIITPHVPSRTLRSSGERMLCLPDISKKLVIATRAFRYSTPKIWNELKSETRL